MFDLLLLGFSFWKFLKTKNYKVDKIMSNDEKSNLKHYLKEYIEFRLSRNYNIHIALPAI